MHIQRDLKGCPRHYEVMEFQTLTGALDEGARLFNEGSFWEAHEAWEQAWKQMEGPDKTHTQGLIQACGVLVHLEKQRPGPARSLGVLALAKLSSSLAFSVDIPGLASFLEKLLKSLDTPLPQIETYLKEARTLRARVRSEK